jgi:hypothetical protein
VWAFDRHAEVVGLFLRELGQLHADAFEVQAGDFFVQMLRQLFRLGPTLDYASDSAAPKFFGG